MNLFDVEVEHDEGDPAGYETGYLRVGKALGSQQVGLSVYELPPGQSICPYHYEHGCEEWLIVLTGTPTLRTPSGTQQLRAWDTVLFPDGPDGAHKVTNETAETLRVAMLSNSTDAGVAVYPDSDKVGAFPPNKLFRLSSEVPYFDGEA